MLAAMADTKYTDYYFNGYAQFSGTGALGVGHINGINLDIRYLKTKNPDTPIYINTPAGRDVFDLVRYNNFIKMAYNRGFKQFYIMPSKNIISGKTKSGRDTMCETLAVILEKTVEQIESGIYLFGSPHEHHVHLQGFTLEHFTITEKNE